MDSNIAFTIFGVHIYWYSLIIMSGVSCTSDFHQIDPKTGV